MGKLDQAWNQANALIRKQALKSTEALKKKYKVTVEPKVGDLVRLHCPAAKVGLKKKLRKDMWQGPCTVTKCKYPNVAIKPL